MSRHWFKTLLLTLLMLGMVGVVSAASDTAPAAPAAGSGIVIEAPDGASGPGIYIVMLAEPPVASYRGGIAGLAPTNPAVLGQVKLDANSPASQAYARYLRGRQADVLAAVEGVTGAEAAPRFTYQHAFNGFAIELTPDQAQAVANLPGVRQVQRSFDRQILTDYGPTWIGAPGIWDGSDTGGLPGTMGEGVIVAVIDTGQNLDHPSFADVGDDGYNHTNPFGSGNYVGLCDTDPGNWVCNDKFIGYWIFTGETTEDTDGHGSHTASTAAGNVLFDTTAILDAPTIDYAADISGVAPHANIIGYDGCNDGGGCPLFALTAAINQTVIDGADVINYSIGGGSSNPWFDSDSLAFLAAFDAGLIPVTSAGNSGPGAGTVGSPADAPWLLAVGASTHNREFANGVIDMTGGTNPPPDIDGAGLTSGYGPAAVVYAADYGDVLCINPFAPGTFNGEIVVCDRGINARMAKSYNVMQGGAGGMILANAIENGDSLNADPHHIPSVHVGYNDGELIHDWLDAGSGHMATIAGATLDLSPANGDIMAAFSSRGPASSVPNVIKPDVTNPGVDIMAAVQTGISDPIVSPLEEFGLISGTSMSSPHTAGSAALVRALHPNWTSAEIRSALMSSGKVTNVFKEDGVTPADPFDIGAGRVDLSKAGRVGLVLDVTHAEYVAANPGAGGDPTTLNLASMADNDCGGSCSWTRTVRSTLSSAQTWNAALSLPAGMTGSVTPSNFTIGAGATQELTISVDVSGLPVGQWAFGNLVLAPSGGGRPVQHMPIAVIPTQSDPDIDVSPTSFEVTQPPNSTTTEELTISNTGASTLNWSIFEDNEAGIRSVDWFDDFDSYATDTNLHGVGGWKGWDNNPAFTAFTRDEQARSAPNSVEITGLADLVQEYEGDETDFWTYTAWQFVPTNFTGESYFIMLNTYNDAPGSKNWSTQVRFVAATNTVINDGLSGGTLPLVKGQWVEIRLEIDLVNDTQAFYYNDQLLYQGTWTDEVSGGGILDIGAVDLFANGASPVYYDDLSLVAAAAGTCAVADDIPWASVAPTSGATAPGDSDIVDVTFDSTGLSAGSYNGTLCVSSDDPDEGLIEVPVTLNVSATDPPDIAVLPDSLSSLQAPGDQATKALFITNSGGSTLGWMIEEAEGSGNGNEVSAPAPDVEPAPVVRSAEDCAQFANYAGAEPEGYATYCVEGSPAPASGSILDPTDLAYAQDIGFVSDNFVSHELGDFPGQTVLGANTMTLFAYDFDASATTLYAIDNTSRNLGTINLANGAFTAIGATGIPAAETISGMSIDPNTNEAYVSTASTSGRIYTLNLATGAATLIGGDAEVPFLIDIAIGPDGTMYGHDISTDSIYTIDRSTGAATLVGPTGVNSNFAQGMDFDNEDGTLYAYTYQGGGANQYGTINLSTGALTPLAVNNPQGEFEGASQTVSAGGATCDNPSDIPWLSVNPASGTTPAGGRSRVVVTFDSTGLADGDYSATLCVNSNDPDEGLVEVPVTLTVDSNVIFADDWESADLSNWDAARTDGGDLAASPAAAIQGLLGMRALIDDNNRLFVADNSPAAEIHYNASFLFDPNSITMDNGDRITLFVAGDFTAAQLASQRPPVPLFGVELTLANGSYRVRGVVRDAAGAHFTQPATLNDSPNLIAVDWQASAPGASNGHFALAVNNALVDNITGLDNENHRIELAALGVPLGVPGGVSGALFFDAFESRR